MSSPSRSRVSSPSISSDCRSGVPGCSDGSRMGSLELASDGDEEGERDRGGDTAGR